MAFKPPRLSTYRKPSTVPVPTNSTPFLTISAKFFKIGGLFIVKRCLTSEDMHISVVLFWMYLFATIAVFIINRPWRANVARGVSSKQWMRIGYISVMDLLSLGFLFFSVSNLSTIRTVMFTEYSEIWAPLLFASTVVDRSNLGGLRSTGSKMVLGTFFAALFLDLINLPSDIDTSSTEDTPFASSFLFGYLFLLKSIVLSIISKRYSKTLTNELGGNKRVFALTVPLSAAMISPIAFLQHVTSSTPPSSFGFVHSLILFSYLGLAFLIGEFYGDYYGYIQCDMKTTVEYGWGMAVTSVALLGFLLHFSFVIDIVDVILLGSLAYGIHNLLQSEPRLMGQSNLPTPAISKSRGFDYPGVEVGNNWTTFRIYIKAILDNKDSRSIFYFLCLNLIYMFVQLAYGVWTNSLGLISDAIHMLFDCMALGVGLFASVMSKWSANKQFSYGFSRIETLSGFANGIFLIFISFFIIVEAIERLIHPPEMNTDRLLLVAVMGFIVNMIGIFSFHHGHGHGGHGHSHGHDHGHDHHHDHNMQGIFLHILADAVGSVGVIISTLLIQWFGWTGFDPLASLVIAILIFISSIPLIRSSMDVLMLKTPAYLWGDIQDALNRVTRIHGVISHSNPQFWPNDSSTIIGSMNVSVTGDTNEQNVVNEVLKLFKEICGIKNSDLIVEIEKVHGTTADSIAAAKNHEHGHRSKEGHSQHSHDRSGHSGAGRHNHHDHSGHSHNHSDDSHSHNHSDRDHSRLHDSSPLLMPAVNQRQHDRSRPQPSISLNMSALSNLQNAHSEETPYQTPLEPLPPRLTNGAADIPLMETSSTPPPIVDGSGFTDVKF